MATLPTLPNLTTFANLPASNPDSPFYIPPVGSYQDNAGNIVSNSTPSSTFGTPSGTNPSTTQASNSTTTAAGTSPSTTPTLTGAAQSVLSFFTGSIENVIFVVIGLLMIGAGVLAFRSSQTIVETVSGGVAKAGKLGAKVAEVAA